MIFHTLIITLLLGSTAAGGYDLNRGLVQDYPIEMQGLITPDPLFNPGFHLHALPGSFDTGTDDSLQLQLIGHYNLAGNYLNMSGWQVRPFGSWVLFSSGGGFYIFSKDSLHKIREVSGPGYIWDFETHGPYVFAASGDKGLVVFDLSSIHGDRVLAQLDLPYEDPNYNEIFGWGATGIELIDTFALITVRIGGLYVVSIADPAHPRIITCHNTHSWLMDVHVRDTFAFVSQYSRDVRDGFIVYSIADPAHPRVITTVPNIGRGMRFALYGDCAFLAGRYEGVYAISIANPGSPTVLGNLPCLEAQNVTVYPCGDTIYGYVANLDNLIVADFTNPTNPYEISTVNVHATAGYIEGNRLYHQGLAGAVLYDLTYPYNPQLDTFYLYLGNPYHLQLRANYAYVYDNYGALRILDISDPGNITELGYTDRHLDSIPSNAQIVGIGGMFIQGDYAYLIVRGYPWFCYLAAVKITDPANPDFVGMKMWTGYAGGNQPFVDESLAYVPTALSGETHLRILNISNPLNMYEIGYLLWPNWAALELVRKDSLLYMAGGYDPYGGTQQTYNDLGIGTVATPSLPRLLGTWTSPNQCHSVDFFDNTQHLAIADYVAGVHILDITSPASPQITGTIALPGYVEDVHVGNNLVFCCADERFAAIDAANRNQPQLYGFYDLFPRFSAKFISCTDVWSQADTLGAVTTTGGLFLFRTGYLGTHQSDHSATGNRRLATITRAGLQNLLQNCTAPVRIFDPTGRLVATVKPGNSAPMLAPGIYQLQTKSPKIPRRLVIVR